MSGGSVSYANKSHYVYYSIPWNWNDNECNPGIWHEALLNRASDITSGSDQDQMHLSIQPENSAASKEQSIPPVKRKKVSPWTRDEHRLFLIGLKKYGKGDWKNIARCCVMSKTSVQVASHAQKYFFRQKNKEKKRASIHDIVLENDDMVDHHLIPHKHNDQHNPIEPLSRDMIDHDLIPHMQDGQYNPLKSLSEELQMNLNDNMIHHQPPDVIQMHQFSNHVEHHNLIPSVDDDQIRHGDKLKWVPVQPHMHDDKHNPTEPLSRNMVDHHLIPPMDNGQMNLNDNMIHHHFDQPSDVVQMHQFSNHIEHRNLIPYVDDDQIRHGEKLRWVRVPPQPPSPYDCILGWKLAILQNLNLRPES
ncbi:hypothetical protein VNO77_00098 [Canavalia gladiata]|uniref:Uncharacterized protein n=1 Tax=Canavalia gladiata TaxID=3824 RepID=A0AAN9R4Z6_CANGL